jgi:hypothetical protein
MSTPSDRRRPLRGREIATMVTRPRPHFKNAPGSVPFGPSKTLHGLTLSIKAHGLREGANRLWQCHCGHKMCAGAQPPAGRLAPLARGAG